MGICFRFLRYTSIKGEEWLEKQLRDVWFGSYKVWVNISRFARTTRNQSNKDRIYNDEKGAVAGNRRQQGSGDNWGTNQSRIWQNTRREGMSYAQVTKN